MSMPEEEERKLRERLRNHLSNGKVLTMQFTVNADVHPYNVARVLAAMADQLADGVPLCRLFAITDLDPAAIDATVDATVTALKQGAEEKSLVLGARPNVGEVGHG